MLTDNLAAAVLFEPIRKYRANRLLILSAYATPNMASWYIKSLQEEGLGPIDIQLLVGMTPYDGLSCTVHDGFKLLHQKKFNGSDSYSGFECSYIMENPPVHANLYIWMQGDSPVKAFTGSADFVQSSFISPRSEIMQSCANNDALSYYQNLNARSIYCSHAEVEEYVTLRKEHRILDSENQPLTTLAGKGTRKETLSLLTFRGDIGKKSGLNWGQRDNRNPNEAYIPLPSSVAKTDFFPKNRCHFTAITDDGIMLILRVEQQNDKAITTPLSNAQLGEYFRRRLGLKNGAYVDIKDLENYGRSDVTFYKVDEEEFFMDFSSKSPANKHD